MRKRSLSSIVKEAASKATFEEKIQVLHQNASESLLLLFTAAYDPRFTFLLPRGATPYKKISGLLDQEGRLYVEMKHMEKFMAVNGQPVKPTLSKIKREMLFLQMLESLDPEDAEMMVAVKDKKFPWKGITARTAQMAFPQLYIGEPKEETLTEKKSKKVKESVENQQQSA